MLDLTPYGFHPGIQSQYQRAAVVAHVSLPEEDIGHYITFGRVSGQWIRFDGIDVEAVSESAALENNFPETDGSTRTANVLFSVSDN
jgi:hypothetical protein